MRTGYVAIIGRPSAGKSTLLNRVLGAKISIVTSKAQTTREQVLGIHTEKRGQIVFVDTPGVHRAKAGGINEFMMSQVKEAVTEEEPSVVWYIVDPASAPKHEQAVLELLQKTRSPVFLLMNKADLARGVQARARHEAFAEALSAEAKTRGIRLEKTFQISAEKGRGVDLLLDDTWAILPEGPLYYPDPDQLSDRPARFFVAEKIREQLLLQLGDELPYSCAVEIERFDEKVKPPRIEATIHVERDSQKGMVIGKGGQKIKEIGQAARQEAEEFLGYKIFLGLQVKVKKDWSKDAEALKRLGYHLPKFNKNAGREKRP